MRIAQIAPLAESVPPKLYGGTERVVSWLTEELVDLGCDVTLFASGDSETRAKLASVCPRALRLSRPPIDPIAGTASLLEAVAKRAKDFDIIHSHIDWIHLPLLRRLGTPCLTTLHGRLDLPFLANMTRGFSDAPFVSISDNQRTPLPALNWAATIYHGLPADLLTPVSRPQGYLAFLGRITPEKGPDIAIRVARAAKMPLKIAAKIPRGETRYFQEEIKPLLDGNQVEFIGEVSDREKTNFLGNAAALLFPISWPEPFGLVMIEAMACGTPIIAWRCGSVPEVIEPGKTGFIVESEADAIKTIGQLHKLNRRSIRKRFEQRFTSRRMAQDYLQCYELVISKMAQSNLMIDGALLDTTRSQHNGVAVVESAYHLP
jgi:glycosyltransferase involved in cell wall biosynthesis